MEQAFAIDERTLYHWLNARGLPAVKANDQYFFNSVEVLEWALKNQVPLTSGTLKLCEKNRFAPDAFTAALSRGGIHGSLPGENPEKVLENVINILPLPAHIDRSLLKEIMVSREQAGTTGIGNGIAVPHVKHPVILAGFIPVVALFFLDTPLDFAASDGRLVHTLFVILTGSFKEHLSLLSRLAFCLQDNTVKAVLGRRALSLEILDVFLSVESSLVRNNE